MAQQGERLQRFRGLLLLAALIVGLGLLLTQCPANRDGMPGQLAHAMEEATSAARSGALALDLWTQQRSTRQLTSVQLSDARDEVLKAYKGIADVRAEDAVDIGRQRMLTEAMTTIIGQLNSASAALRRVTSEPLWSQSAVTCWRRWTRWRPDTADNEILHGGAGHPHRHWRLDPNGLIGHHEETGFQAVGSGSPMAQQAHALLTHFRMTERDIDCFACSTRWTRHHHASVARWTSAGSLRMRRST
jgi:hypothetical protein